MEKKKNLFYFEWCLQRKKKKLSAYFWHGGEEKSLFLWKGT